MELFTLTVGKNFKLKQKFLCYIFVGFSAFISGCSSDTFGGRNSEGRIIYNIEYEDNNIDALSRSMLPSEAEFYFTKDKSVFILSSTGNLFRFSMITDNKKKIVTQELKVMGKKVKAVFNDRDIFYYQDHPGFTIIETNYSDTIAGYYGDVSIIIFDEINEREFPIVHTNEINITDPNWYNLYKEIPSVLLQYEYIQFGKKFILRAKNVAFFKVDKTLFIPNPEYLDVTPEDLMEELRKTASMF
jgi:hypothetical protein